MHRYYYTISGNGKIYFIKGTVREWLHFESDRFETLRKIKEINEQATSL